MIAPCSNGVIKYNAVVVNSRDESIEFAVLIWPPPCIFNGHCDVGPLRMAPRLVLRTIGSRELQDGDFVRIVNCHYNFDFTGADGWTNSSGWQTNTVSDMVKLLFIHKAKKVSRAFLMWFYFLCFSSGKKSINELLLHWVNMMWPLIPPPPKKKSLHPIETPLVPARDLFRSLPRIKIQGFFDPISNIMEYFPRVEKSRWRMV